MNGERAVEKKPEVGFEFVVGHLGIMIFRKRK